MSGALPDNFGVFPINSQVKPDPRFTYLTPEQRRQWLELVTPERFRPPAGVRCIHDQPYGPHPKQRLDVYLPPETGRALPVVFYIHGGSWTVGERDSAYINCCFGCVEHGFAVIAADYRLLPDTGYPDNLDDVCAAVAWARENAEEYGFDARRFGMIGDSAGGYLTLMCALTRKGSVQAACAQFAPTSLLPADEDGMFLESGLPRHGPPAVPSLYSALFGSDDEQTLSSLSPVNLIGPDMPPLLLQHGTRDAIIPYQMSSRFAEKAKSLYPGCAAECRLYEGYVHSDPRFLSQGPRQDVIRFFKAQLGR